MKVIFIEIIMKSQKQHKFLLVDFHFCSYEHSRMVWLWTQRWNCFTGIVCVWSWSVCWS